MSSLKLTMTFIDAAANKHSITEYCIKPGITGASVSALMDSIITHNIFTSAAKVDLKSKYSAIITDMVVTPLDIQF